MTAHFDTAKNFFAAHRYTVVTLLYALLNSFLIYYQLELGNGNPFMNGLLYTALNILTIFVLMSVVYIFVQRWWISSLIISIPITLLSVANNYTLIYRNFPISTQDIHNAGTALDVLDGYSLGINLYIVGIIVFFILSICVTLILKKREKGQHFSLKKILIKDVCILLAGSIFIYISYFSPYPIKPRNTFLWSWEASYHTYGYVANTIEILEQSLNVISKPSGYSEETLENTVMSAIPSKDDHNTPDIIFILNETFYDMRDVVDLGNTPSVMPFIDSLPENNKGRTVVVNTGGSTNKSEYEFLTGNSMQLMQGITPFNYLDFNRANSIVSHLESNGYTTLGAHCADSLNYSRNKVYPQLGFDITLFEEEFAGAETYAERPYFTDSSSYRRILKSYEQMGDNPRFVYLLTMQNHGGWGLNPKTRDLVSVDADFGEYTEQVNEYLSCISLSDKAFQELVQYFENSDRQVIICMVGDHCPSFMSGIVDENNIDISFKLRSTPYIIWSNFPLNTELTKTTSLPYMAPMVLDAAGCPSSPFYSYMSQMQKDVPVITAFDVYKTADGKVHLYTDETPYTDTINTYLSLVYNNASPKSNRIEALFASAHNK